MKTILLVDDEYALVESLTELLEDEGYRVVSAANGEDGLETLRREKADLVVSDIMMPLGGGSEFVKRLRAVPEFRLTPVLITSAASKESLDGSRLQVSAFLVKPFYFEKLLAIVVRLIGKGRQDG